MNVYNKFCRRSKMRVVLLLLLEKFFGCVSGVPLRCPRLLSWVTTKRVAPYVVLP